ncbi:MAG: L,D-transpeptidase family protein [Candidatus Cloacimonetes bacterium]|nr:L,D-transpeptidase family protein [Candidatus Cloacimonadota bacterium]
MRFLLRKDRYRASRKLVRNQVKKAFASLCWLFFMLCFYRRVSAEAEVQTFINSNPFEHAFTSWKISWESQNIEQYLQYYTEDFESVTSGMNYEEWVSHKRRVFARKQPINIEFSDLKHTIENNRILIEMYQDYQSGNYQDFGIKTMIWVRKDLEWRILNEEWTVSKPPEVITPPKPPVEIVVPKPDTISIKWEIKSGSVPFEYINFLFDMEQDYGQYLLIVEKKEQHSALYRFKENFTGIEIVKTFRISSGKATGNKFRRDDLKTPEGLYITQRFIEEAKLPAKYGSGAFVLNYPNQLDKLLKKTGSGIWIHGSDTEMVSFDTEGCVRFENSEIIYFTEELEFEKIPVIINEELEWRTITSLEKEILDINAFLEKWQDVWQKQDIETYLSFYADDFHTVRQKMDYTQWVKHKTRIFNPNNEIKLDVFDLSFYYADNLLLVSFYQDYTTTTLKSFGKKQLVLKRLPNDWIIIQEEWEETPRVKEITSSALNP